VNLPGEQCDGSGGGCAPGHLCAANCTCAPCVSTVVPAGGGTFSGTTSGPSRLAGTCGNSAFSGETVFEWTPAASGTAVIETCGAGTNYDSVVYVRTGGCTGPEIACNDDGCTNARSIVTPFVTAGTTYVIVVDGYGGGTGNFVLGIHPPPSSPSTAFLDCIGDDRPAF
jgi:hypothetical protein